MEYVNDLTSNTINMEIIPATKQYNQQIKRGRGRPRKNQVISNIEKDKKTKIIQTVKQVHNRQAGLNSNKKQFNEEIILHLPISLNDLNISKICNTDAESTQNNFIIGDSDTNNNSNIFTIEDINGDSYSDSNFSNESHIIINDLKLKNKELEKTIAKLEKEIDEYKSLLYGNNLNNINTRKVSKMNVDLIDLSTGNAVVVEKTNIACWWCTHNFDTLPCFIPEKILNDKYHVFGCFCSYNCAAAYIFQMENSYMWDRYSLLKKLYNAIQGDIGEIISAPSRLAFTKFGGTLTYEEFRKNCKTCMKEYRFIMPPMTSIVPLIEEGYTDATKVNVSLADLNKRSALRRKNPLPNTRNTLFETLCFKEK